LRLGKATTSAVVIGVGFRGGRFFFRRLAFFFDSSGALWGAGAKL
jgi:hypothetical protein